MKNRNSKDQLLSDIKFLQELERAIKQNNSHEALMLVRDWKSELREMTTNPVTTPWCQIFDIEGNQVLVRIKMNTEEDQLELSQMVQLEGAFVEASIGFEGSTTDAEEAFEKYGEQNAKKFLNAMINLLNGN